LIHRPFFFSFLFLVQGNIKTCFQKTNCTSIEIYVWLGLYKIKIVGLNSCCLWNDFYYYVVSWLNPCFGMLSIGSYWGRSLRTSTSRSITTWRAKISAAKWTSTWSR
jgi:hypothetical protein